MAAKEDNVAEALSPAAKYKQMLLETGCGQGPNEDKMILVFKVLDQILPHMGVFVEVMKLCRDELFEAIYSDQYTGSDQDKKKKRYIQRLPFFTLVKRVYDERDEKNDQLTAQLDNVKEKLFNKQVQYEEACDKIDNLEKDVEYMKSVIEDLEKDLAEKNNDYESLEQTLDEVKDAADKAEYQLHCDIEELKEDLHDARTEAAFLQQFKTGYDDLQEAFMEQPDYDVSPKRKITPPIATKRAHFISSIENANKLEEQILAVQNATMEEFDKFLEKHKEQLSEHVEVEDDPMAARDVEMEIDAADHQLLMEQRRFEKSIEDMNLELGLLRQQRGSFMEQLQILEENKPAVREKRSKKVKGSRPETQESSLSIELEQEPEEEKSQMDPFSLQERIFSRYASMLYASDNNGKTFHEFKDAEYCKSCGEKTVVCPHKILRQEHVFNLPPNATHLKLSRPKVRLNDQLISEALKEARGGKEGRLPLASSKSMRSRVSISAQMSPYTQLTKTPGSDTSGLSGFGEGDLDAAHFLMALS